MGLKNMKDEEVKDMIENWVCIEDDPDVINEEIDKFLEEIEKTSAIEVGAARDADAEDDIEEIAEMVPVEEISNAKAMESISVLREYCAQQGFDREIKNLLEKFDRKIRTTKLARAKNSPSLLNFFSVKNKKSE